MFFAGFQKLTLLDFPGRVACIVFTKGCNFRCPFCHNASLVENRADDDISEDEILDFLKKRKGVLDGICISGGEPTLVGELGDFISKVRSMGFAVKLDTNGTNPLVLSQLISSGMIDYVAMDIKNSPQKYSLTVGCDVDMDRIYQSIEIVMSSGVDYEFRTTFVKELHTPQDIVGIAQMIKGAKQYFLQNFVDSGDILCQNLSAFSEEEMKKLEKEAQKHLKSAQIRGL